MTTVYVVMNRLGFPQCGYLDVVAAEQHAHAINGWVTPLVVVGKG